MKRKHRTTVRRGNERGFKGWIFKCTCGDWQGNHHKSDELRQQSEHEEAVK